MEDEDRQKKLETAKAKLAAFQQRKSYADSQKKKKKKKKKKSEEDSEPACSADNDDQAVGGQAGTQEAPTVSERSFAKTLRSGETIKHDQIYTIEPESEVSTTADDNSSEEEAEREATKEGRMQDVKEALAAKSRAVEELSRELQDIRAAFGTEGVQKLQDFEAALKQRDGIITQLTANLQQARKEKDEIMREFLMLTEQSQKLQIQFQQLQAGEALRNTSHSSTAADLLQAKQQLAQYQLQLDEVKMEAGKNQAKSDEQRELIGQLQLKISDLELSGRRSVESFTQKLSEKDALIAVKEKVIMNQDQSLAQLRAAEESLATTLKEKNVLLSEQTASFNLFREEVAILGQSANDIRASDEKDLIIAEQERVISDRDCSLSRLEQELEISRQSLRGLQQRVSAKESELEKYVADLQNTKRDLESSKGEMESCKSHLEKARDDLQSCQSELEASRQKERTSSDEIKQLMGTVEDLQRRCHRDSLSEGDLVQRMQQDADRKLDLLRAELDEMYGQQIVHMKQELNLRNTARLGEATAEHRAAMGRQLEEAGVLKEQNSKAKETLTEKIQELQVALAQSASEFNREKSDLQAELQNLRGDLRSAKEKAQLASDNLVSRENQQEEVRRLLVTVDDLQRQLAGAGESAREVEAQHESETTNYKIKLEMLEREKDAVLDRMAESQEAELERLRTQLLFSHEEELTLLRQELRRESFLNAENLLNEASVKHQKSLDDLRRANEEQVALSQRENAAFSNERQDLLRRIHGLKEDLEMASDNARSDELERKVRELRIELEVLRQAADERARLENENQTLLKKSELLEESERQWKDRQQGHDVKMLEMESVASQLREEMETQRTTFSLAEKNFQADYQNLKEEFSHLLDAKTQLEERTLKEALEFQAQIAALQSQAGEREGENVRKSAQAEEKASELTEKLRATLHEKESLAEKLSQVAQQLVDAENETARSEEVTKTREEEHRDHIRSLRGEIQSLEALLKAAEAERDGVRRTPERAVEGRASPQKPAGSNRRKRRQRLKQERRASGSAGEPSEAARQKEEEAEEEEEDESRATSAAESEMQTESQLGGDEADGCREDGPIKQDECKLETEAQRISLTYIHAAQLELLQEESGYQKNSGHQDLDSLQMLKAEALEKQRDLEESHQMEMERLRDRYSKSNAETEERCAAELAALRRQLQELTEARAADSGLQSSPERSEEHQEDLKDLSDEQLCQWVSGSRSGLSAKLQALRRELYNEYVHEVAALKEQHRAELSGLREQLEKEGERRDTIGPETAGEPLGEQRVEEEVAKAIVHMSVEYAQQTELARINKLAGQTSVAMQTPSDGEEEAQENVPDTPSSYLNEERGCMEKELRDRNAEIQKLRRAEKPLQVVEDGEEKVEDEDGMDEDIHKDSERTVLRRANERLSRVLADVLKTTAAAEETMGLHMQSLQPDASSSAGPETSAPTASHVTDLSGKISPDDDDAFLGDDEGHLKGLGSRLQTALEKMLMVITDTTNQVEHARITQTELMRESFRHNQEISELLQKQEELQERLAEEARAREQLALELHRAEGVIDGYTGERAALEEQLRQKEELQLNLEQDLQVTASRLQELEQERLQMQEERELVSRQQDAMRGTAGPRELCLVEAAMVAAPEADLLEETEKLMKEKVEVQRQAEKESADLLKQMKVLEAELEEQVNRVIELEQAGKTETGDLQQQIQALEKQLDKNRRFLDEQAVDREHERDVFQNEIQELERQLKNPQKFPSGSEQRSQQVDGVFLKVEQLSSQLKEKADRCSELLLGSEQLRREQSERDQEIDKLESRVRELEQALLASAESLEKDEENRRHASITEAKHSNLEAQLHTEREALERKEKEICHLEEQLEQFREELENKSEEVQQLHMQLEIQRKEICSQQQFLETRETMLQVMEEKDRAIALLNEQNSKLQHLEKASGNKGIDRRDALINDLESQVECFKSEQERLKRNSEEEQEQLNSVIEKLQQELVHMERKEDVEAHAGEQYDEMKQRMDAVTAEFSALKLEHAELLEIHRRSKESGENSEELVESLRQRTASLLVAQAQVKALEKNAASNVDELQVRIRELENQKDTQVREKVASEVVSQVTLEALQKQLSKDNSGDKVSQLNQKLGELETSLGGIERNDKLRKQLLSRSKEELAEYERRLVALVDLMRLVVGTHPMMTEDLKASVAHQALLSELQQAKEESLAAKKQLDHHEEQCHHLREQLKDKTETVDRLKEQLEKASSEGAKETQELREELAKTQKEAMVAKEDLSSCKETLEKLQDLLQERELTIAGLKEDLLHVKAEENNAERIRLLQDLQEVQSNADASKDQVDSYKSQNERLNDDIKKQELSLSKLQDQLREVQKNMDVTREEVSSYKSHNEKLQEDIQLREVSISKLKEEVQAARENDDTSTKELNSYKSHIVKLQEDVKVSEHSNSRLEEELQEVERNMDTTKEELDCYKSRNEKLNEEIQQQKVTISKMEEELQKNVDSTNEQVSRYKSHNEKLDEEIQQQKVTISELEEEIRKKVDSTDEQLSSYKSHNEKLKLDIQVWEESLLKLKGELQDGQKKMESTKEELDNYKSFNEKLQEEVEARDISISKLKEDLQEVNKMVDSTREVISYKSGNEKLQEDLKVYELSITKLKQELQESQKTMESTKEELESYKSHNEKLQEEIQSREVTILNLKVELQELQKNVDSTLQLRSAKSNNEEQGLDEGGVLKIKKELQELKKFADTTKEELRNSKSHNEKLKVELREARAAAAAKAARSSSASPSPVASPQPFSSSSQTKRKASGKLPLPKVSKEKATPLSRKALTPSTSPEPTTSDAATQTAADEDLLDVVGEFREKAVQMRELHAAEILDMEARHISESDALRREVQNLEDECKTLKVVIDKLRVSEVPLSRQDRPQSLFKDGYTSDSSSDYSQRTGCDLPGGLQQEFRVTPEGAGRDADDSVLPDRIKSLLREVHQEGMHVLSLSDFPVSDGEPDGTSNVWLKQRDALLSTVESLKGLIAHMQTKQMSGDSADWRAELLEAVRQVFVRERGVLKSSLYGQLDLVDTSDAVIHLNQLELKLAEQDAQHKVAMSSLHAADRSSLMAEIYHLRVQMEHLHQGARPATKEQRGGGDADGAGRTDRLLLEELKGELSHTKLELETTLLSQHKHLKELDTLRAEVSQKASEVDVLNEQLLEESRKGRELQWTVEKERCRAGRSEQNALEQLEDLNLALEEQKSQAEQLTATLEQERQESSRLCQQAEKEKLGLQRRLQELRVQLETEQSKSQEMRAALGTAKELRVGGGSASHQEDLLEELHNELDDKQAQVLDLLGEIEAVKLEVLRKDQQLNQVGLESKQSHEALLDVQARLERVESRLSETRNQLATEESRRKKLQEDKKLEESSARDGSGGRGTPRAHQHHHGPWRTADAVLGKMHLLASKIHGVACDGAAQITEDELALLRSNVDDVIGMLQQSPGLPSIAESAILLAGGSSTGSSLTERLLRQNAELTGFVGRLTEEKNDLRNHSLRLEEQLRCCRHAGDTSGGRKGASGPDSADVALLSREKEAWSQEKVRLEKALDQALAQVARLKGEMRSDMLREITGPEADNALLKRMYGRYLRSESFRKALVYQKKYLLLLLGGFQECEEATLALLSRMGGRPPDGPGGGPRGQRGRGLTRFRSAVRVSIALSRMRFLVKRWHKTTGTSNACCVAQKSDTTRIIGTDERDHLHPGVDVFRDRGGSSSRGRSGRESPRSPVSAAQHRFHAAGDQGMLTCAHLQSYDPDRALTDYISRLEALQRRLGSVTPGASSSVAPLHFSLRR